MSYINPEWIENEQIKGDLLAVDFDIEDCQRVTDNEIELRCLMCNPSIGVSDIPTNTLTVTLSGSDYVVSESTNTVLDGTYVDTSNPVNGYASYKHTSINSYLYVGLFDGVAKGWVIAPATTYEYSASGQPSQVSVDLSDPAGSYKGATTSPILMKYGRLYLTFVIARALRQAGSNNSQNDVYDGIMADYYKEAMDTAEYLTYELILNISKDPVSNSAFINVIPLY